MIIFEKKSMNGEIVKAGMVDNAIREKVGAGKDAIRYYKIEGEKRNWYDTLELLVDNDESLEGGYKEIFSFIGENYNVYATRRIM